MDVIKRFSEIFSGLTKAYGTYITASNTEPGKKNQGRAKTVHEPVTLALWERHLDGSTGLGIVPIREDSTAVFGAIDIDVYDNLDLNTLALRVRDLGLPLITCRTKSGGAHLYLFTSTPVPAALMRRKLKQFATHLGYPNVEIFPKQDKLSDADTGNWINMPYFGGDRSTRYAIGNRALSTNEFLAFVDKVSVLDQEALALIAPKIETIDILPGAPPCLLALAKMGFPQGGRNSGLFNLGIYAKKAYPENWKEQLIQFNIEYMKPPLAEDEVKIILGSLGKKTYSYKCKDAPIVSVCDRPKCLTCEHGVGNKKKEASISEMNISFGELTKVLTMPPIWLWELNSEIMEFTTKDLMSQRAFHTRTLETINVWPPVTKPEEWRNMIQEAVTNATTMAVPEDATTNGQVWDALAKFCTSRIAGRSIDELLLGKPFTDEERSHFIVSDFIAHLIQHRFPGRVNERDIYLMLRSHDLKHHHSVLKGKPLNYWSVPAFKVQTEPHTVPKEPVKEAM